MNPKAFLWDVDGVFVDTERLHFDAWKKMFAQFGKELTIEEYLPCIGKGSRENTSYLCGRKGIPDEYEKLNPIRRNFYEELRTQGIPLIVENIKLARDFAQQFPQTIHAAVSSASRKDIEGNLAAAGIKDIFQSVISFEDDPAIGRKPEPDIYLYAAKKIGVAPGECTAFEDSANGVFSAHAAGVTVVAIPNELTVNQDFSKADLIILPGEEKSPEKILEKLAKV